VDYGCRARSLVCRSIGEPAVRAARAGRAAGVELQLHRDRRRHCVLLLERGGLPYRDMSNQQHFTDALADTSLASPAQRFVSEDGVLNARARVLGGGSFLNAGFYTRASSDYERVAGWDARLVNSSYLWVESALVFRPDVPTDGNKYLHLSL
jgi:hypothetical protein